MSAYSSHHQRINTYRAVASEYGCRWVSGVCERMHTREEPTICLLYRCIKRAEQQYNASWQKLVYDVDWRRTIDSCMDFGVGGSARMCVNMMVA